MYRGLPQSLTGIEIISCVQTSVFIVVSGGLCHHLLADGGVGGWGGYQRG